MVENLTNDTTVIIIAHRLQSIVNCDRILYIDHGSVTEEGSHQQLLAKKGHYFQLWQDQTSY
jgi:ABC-type multidrug transport system fused ATPase/permease subunit